MNVKAKCVRAGSLNIYKFTLFKYSTFECIMLVFTIELIDVVLSVDSSPRKQEKFSASSITSPSYSFLKASKARNLCSNFVCLKSRPQVFRLPVLTELL
jgi:hypothetical protein